MKHRKQSMNLFYVPALVLMLLFVAYPFYEAVRLSFFSWNGYSPEQTFVGMKNYVRMLGDENFRLSFKNTLFYGFGCAFLQNVLALLFALLLNTRFRGHSVVRTVIYLPVMISGLIMGYIISFFVQFRGGVFNEILAWMQMAPVDWMADGHRGVWIIMLVNSWQYVGISMIIYIAGLQNIPTVYYEAASIDGASTLARFYNITLPLIVPAMSTAVIQNIIGSLKLYDVIISLSEGGPGFSTHSLSTYISNQYFKAQNAGYSAAVGIFTFVFILIVSVFFTKYFTKRGGVIVKKSQFWKYLVSAAICMIYLAPIYVLVIMSFKTVTDKSSRLALPAPVVFTNYVKVFLGSDLVRAFKNTCIVTFTTVAAEVVVACMAAYPLARNRSRFNGVIRMLFMGVMMIPSLSILVGVYSTLVSLHAISTYWGIVLVSVAFGLPMPIFLYTNFIVSIPQSLDEASAIDGCNSLQTFFRIILPQLKPITASIIILNGVGMWNEYGYSLYILQKPKMYTLTLMISQYFSSSAVSDLNGAAAAACVAIAPVVLLYLFLQKYFVQGQLDSAVKG